ncbi:MULTISPECIES: ABC transporter permease [unclassified Nocardioides]|uniref:ABC transporter permease n=1 Tax=unclassified Nocardioides TaxID=2615069 RepID=UPI00114F0854|nr:MULTISPECIES: ABC transporter permease [unclassified Nocardioides]TQK72699.1 putative ABC transport system permease protein [Nocardioides sp. SLBN-35]WGY03098.1 ABC transporter permease [Nocardioides sp. QY071]
MSSRNLVLGSARELGTVGLVGGLGSAYAAVLIMTSSNLASMASEGGGVGVLLGSVATVFILIALYVSVVVIANCVDTVIAGRLRHIALLRLLGARGPYLRRSVMRGTALVGLAGGVAGAVAGVVLADLTRVVLVARGTLPEADYALVHPLVLLSTAAVAVAAMLAGWLGSRAVLRVSPAQAMSGTATELPRSRSGSVLRAIGALMLIGGGFLVLLLSTWLGEDGSAAGFLAAFFGSVLSATGLLIGARFVIPALVGACSRLVGTRPPAVLARRNAVKDPLRTTRSTMGLVIGVTLVTTFASGMQALRDSVGGWELDPAQQVQTDQILATTTAILIAIVVISSVIAAVGFVSTMSLTVIQRQREIGLLRSLGFTQVQVRSMITRESIALSATAVAFGMLLGLVYGSVGAQSLIGFGTDGFVWGVPWLVLAGIAACGVVLVLAASRAPARRAVAVTPIEALRIEA